MSKYVESIMSPGETIQYQGKVSKWSFTPHIIVGLLLTPVLIGPLFWLIAFLQYRSTELAITNKRIVAKFGFISRRTVELLLPKVESIQIDQSVFGRMLNYGSVVVSGAGNPQTPVPGISDPVGFRSEFMKIQEASNS